MNIPWRELFHDALEGGPRVIASFLQLHRHQRLPLPDLCRLQERQLARMMKHACREVPFYERALPGGEALRSSDVPGGLTLFPIVDRGILTGHWDQFVAGDAARYAPRPRRTSGTTGKPLEVLLDRRTRALNRAITLMRMEWAGWKPGDRTVVFNAPLGYFSGGRIDFESPYLLDSPRRTLILNGARLSDERLRHFCRALREYRPHILRGFPSTLVLLARSMKREKIRVPLRAVMTGGELVLDWQRQLLEDTFECRVFDFYGMWESVGAAAQCDRGEYHVIPGLGFLDIMREGLSCGPGEAGEIVGTHLANFSMPLIRYNTHDLAAWTGEPCSCGRQLPTLSIIGGRGRDLLVTRTGYCVVPAGLPTRFVPPLPIEKLQFFQEKKGEALIRIVRGRGYAPEHTRMLLGELEKELGESVTFSWEYVDDIHRGPSGKYRFVISSVPFEL